MPHFPPFFSHRAFKGVFFPALMLALALGTVMALFSLLEQMVLRPLPVPDQDRVVALEMQATYSDGSSGGESPSPVELKEAGAFPWLEAGPVQKEIKFLRVEFGNLTRSSLVAYASADFFTAFRILPSEGRLFAQSDPEPGAVLSWSAWQRIKGTVSLGSRVKVDGVPLPLLGVLPKGFNGFWPGYEPEFWVTLEARALSGAREARYLTERGIGLSTYGRLRPGITPAQAQAAFGPIVAGWQERISTPPQRLRKPKLRTLLELRHEAWGRFLPSASLLWISAGLLVLMATLNLGNLQVARWMQQRQAWSTRMALGASPIRLVWEMSLPMLATLALGALGALPLGLVLGHLIARFPPPSEWPTTLQPGMDWRVYFIALALTGILAMLLVLMAAIWFLRHTCRVDLRQSLGGLRWRKVLLGTQLALSVVLLCGTLGSLQDLWKARKTPLGMELRGIHAFSFGLPTHVPEGRKHFLELWNRLYDHFKACPEVQATSVVIPPCEAYEPTPHLYRSVQGCSAGCLMMRIHPGTFQLLQIPLLLGRDFSDSDTLEAPPVAIVSQPLARQLWPGQSPLGQVIENAELGRRAEVIGVVAEHRWEGPTHRHYPAVFFTSRQGIGPLQTLMIRSAMPQEKLYDWVEREITKLDPRLAMQRAEPLAERLDRVLQPQRLAATLFGMMGAAALVLSLLGLYALQHHLTVQRLPEAGLRMALGATPGRVRWEYLHALKWPMGIGLAVGLGGTWAAWRWMASVLPGLPPMQISTLLWVCVGLLVTGLLAALLPMLGLGRASPAELLRDSNS